MVKVKVLVEGIAIEGGMAAVGQVIELTEADAKFLTGQKIVEPAEDEPKSKGKEKTPAHPTDTLA